MLCLFRYTRKRFQLLCFIDSQERYLFGNCCGNKLLQVLDKLRDPTENIRMWVSAQISTLAISNFNSLRYISGVIFLRRSTILQSICILKIRVWINHTKVITLKLCWKRVETNRFKMR